MINEFKENTNINEHDIPFTDEWHDKQSHQMGMLNKSIETALVSASFKIVSMIGVMLIIVSVVHSTLN